MNKKRNYIKITLIILTACILLIGVIIIGINHIFSGMCGNTICSSSLSPNKKYKAIVFQRDCGATTGFSTQISLIKANKNLPNKSGNIFIADGHPDKTKIKLLWINNTHIMVSHLEDLEIFKNEKLIKNIAIDYEPTIK